MAPPQQRSLVRSSGTAFLQAKAEFPTLDVHPTHGRPFSKPHPWKEPLAVSMFVCAWFLVDTLREDPLLRGHWWVLMHRCHSEEDFHSGIGFPLGLFLEASFGIIKIKRTT